MEKKELLRAQNITRVYGKGTPNEMEALHPTNVTIYEGEFVAIMGPSGAGKSTLLTILSTLDFATKGGMYLDGENAAGMEDKYLSKFRNENLGYISQDLTLIDTLTMEENIGIPLYVSGKSQSYIKQKVEEVAKLCHIEKLLKKLPGECSGGQVQRATVCRGLVNDPKLIIADEPTGNLDSKNAHEVLMIFKELNKKGTGVVVVTHDCQIASYSNKTLYVLDGNIKEIVEKGDMSQEEYYQKLVELTSEDIDEIFNEE
ncbi:MAG: ABC transporter ATP-binding protein [Firmicutes bacterium]|nr:ABC transporter ATP-binding protein [Bacillota bacterium]